MWKRRTVHLERRRGSPDEAAHYCKKESNWTPSQTQELLLTLPTSISQTSYVIRAESQHTRRNHRTQCIWFWGKTGSVCYLGDPSLKWFDPYRGEKGSCPLSTHRPIPSASSNQGWICGMRC
jgi:hypothetical protein